MTAAACQLPAAWLCMRWGQLAARLGSAPICGASCAMFEPFIASSLTARVVGMPPCCRCGSSWSAPRRRCSASCCMQRAASACWRHGWRMRNRVRGGRLLLHQTPSGGSPAAAAAPKHRVGATSSSGAFPRWQHFHPGRELGVPAVQTLRRSGSALRWSRHGWGSWKGCWPSLGPTRCVGCPASLGSANHACACVPARPCAVCTSQAPRAACLIIFLPALWALLLQYKRDAVAAESGPDRQLASLQEQKRLLEEQVATLQRQVDGLVQVGTMTGTAARQPARMWRRQAVAWLPPSGESLSAHTSGARASACLLPFQHALQCPALLPAAAGGTRRGAGPAALPAGGRV